jgi:hypothetical protein
MGRYDDIRNGTGTNATPGVYDIVKEYDWTSVPRASDLRNEAPSAYITAYELKYSQLRSFIDGYMNILSPQNNAGSYSESKNPGLDFYKGLYTVKDGPIARLNFPFFEDSFRSFSTEFADTFSPISQRGAQMFGGQALQGLGGAAESLAGGGMAAVNALASFGDTGNSGDQSLADKIAKTVSGAATSATKALGLNPGQQTIGTPGSYIETPKFYQYSNTDNGLQIGFTLSNTLEDDSIDKNFKFICDFTKMNRPYRYGPIGMDFPAIYNLVVPGLRYIQWAYLENFEVSMLGNRRRIGSRVIPEAYVCNFTFRSLTVEPANFVEEICDNRDAFGDFDSYAANQAKEELGFQKGKYQRERAFNKRSKLAKAFKGGEIPEDHDLLTGKPIKYADDVPRSDKRYNAQLERINVDAVADPNLVNGIAGLNVDPVTGQPLNTASTFNPGPEVTGTLGELGMIGMDGAQDSSGLLSQTYGQKIDGIPSVSESFSQQNVSFNNLDTFNKAPVGGDSQFSAEEVIAAGGSTLQSEADFQSMRDQAARMLNQTREP